ncbi:hypothetical protein TRM7615_04005 [Falsiruegeria mediterranea M17]|jgi:hypothetical protein|uniref:Uncharacterized protein n=1 Tax=Falsiruegeria mediterranea M17 TaxID=1200281 RepID=A0A2R8CDJ2_9RHOB|nr:hypothetical protein TRM7615_04005 [Falsiruegeria mediterranea M17]
MRLSECRYNLRHFELEDTLRVGKGRSVAPRVPFMPLGRVRPDLDTYTFERRAVIRAMYAARHQKAAATDALNDGGARQVIV